MTLTNSRPAIEIEGIQYLRGIAALMVVAHHAPELFPAASGWFKFGSTGVDIFFVISGFVMAHSTRVFSADRSRYAQAVEFLCKRFIRVAPLYWLALLWTGKVLLLRGEADLAFVKDFLFIPRLHSSGQTWPLLVPGWSINYEIIFYAIFAGSMIFGTWRYMAVFGAIFLLTACGATYHGASVAIRFYGSSIVLEFLLGIAVYSAIRCGRFVPPRATLFLILAAAIIGIAADNGDVPRVLADGPFAVVIVWSVVLLARGTECAFLRLLGDASYSIYLFHFAAFGLARQALQYLGWTPQTDMPTLVAVLAPIPIGVGTGLVLHRVLERPLLAWLRSWSKRSLQLGAGA